MLERLVFNHLISFLSDSISPVQFGFLKEHSSLQQLLLFYDSILASKSSVEWDVVFLDFAKAFDSVPHNELLLKLRRLGVSGNLWLRGYKIIYLRGTSVCALVRIAPIFCLLFLASLRGVYLAHFSFWSLSMTFLNQLSTPFCTCLLTMPNVPN
ncbi:hypothetical protein SPONN_698 [uncultured Candidatus Thioglobus sp.]|nr:hypothetical protein SPONN_698 [uncultured Candidatus Thioglobus sp.]